MLSYIVNENKVIISHTGFTLEGIIYRWPSCCKVNDYGTSVRIQSSMYNYLFDSSKISGYVKRQLTLYRHIHANQLCKLDVFIDEYGYSNIKQLLISIYKNDLVGIYTIV